MHIVCLYTLVLCTLHPLQTPKVEKPIVKKLFRMDWSWCCMYVINAACSLDERRGNMFLLLTCFTKYVYWTLCFELHSITLINWVLINWPTNRFHVQENCEILTKGKEERENDDKNDHKSQNKMTFSILKYCQSATRSFKKLASAIPYWSTSTLDLGDAIFVALGHGSWWQIIKTDRQEISTCFYNNPETRIY